MTLNAMKFGIPVLKRLIPSIKKRFARLYSNNDFIIVKTQFAYFLLNPNNFVDRQIAYYDDFEEEQVSRLFKEMTSDVDLFLDIGANIGYYSVLAALRTPAKRIVAFEPDIRNVHQFGANLLLNGIDQNVEVIAKAVSSETKKLKFHLAHEGFTGSSRVVTGPEESIEIEATRIDDILSVANKNIFIKIDIEGHELEALYGMKNLMRNNRVFLQVEIFREKIPLVIEFLSALSVEKVDQIDHEFYFSNY